MLVNINIEGLKLSRDFDSTNVNKLKFEKAKISASKYECHDLKFG